MACHHRLYIMLVVCFLFGAYSSASGYRPKSTNKYKALPSPCPCDLAAVNLLDFEVRTDWARNLWV